MFSRFYTAGQGTNPFASRYAILHDLDDSHAQANLQEDRLPDFEPNFGELWLTDDSSLVDFVDDGFATGGLGAIVSKKALAVLETLKLPPHRSYPLIALHCDRKISDRYFWLQMISVQYYDWIDFSKSRFRLKSQLGFDGVEEEVKIHNAGELRVLIDGLGANDQDLSFSKIVFNEKYNEYKYDFFYLDRLDGIHASKPIVSERLKAALQTNQLVGYELRDVALELTDLKT